MINVDGNETHYEAALYFKQLSSKWQIRWRCIILPYRTRVIGYPLRHRIGWQLETTTDSNVLQSGDRGI